MQHDREITISVGRSRKETHWVNQTLLWSVFVERLRTPQRTTETYQDFMRLSKPEQDELKDVGGFVGGALSAPRRKPANVAGRDLVTLDLDNLGAGMTAQVLEQVKALGCAAVVYSTRKHSTARPRLRLIVPTARTMTADEYEPVARKLAEHVGISYADPTTFEVARLMYWPSVSSDSEYVYEVVDAPFLSVETVLGEYDDWRDVASWTQVPGDAATPRKLATKQEDPTSKHGIVGAFCCTYDIFAAMAAFIPTAYDATDDANRYTYLGGSTTGGAVVYEGGKFLYSHHATDPCSGKLVNAWDMVRLHKFGELDEEAKDSTPVGKLPSWQAMVALARADKQVMTALDQERHAQAVDVFGAQVVDVTDKPSAEDTEWLAGLERTQNGDLKKTTANIITILEHDQALRGKVALDEFACRGMALGALPWNPEVEQRMWTDVDSAGVRHHLETYYHITGTAKIDDALALVSFTRRINRVKDYLMRLEWDGVKRLDTLLHDYLGAEQNAYTAAVMRKSLAAAVARAVKGSVKWDYMPIFAGAQGLGKSTFLSKLGKEWFCDSLEEFGGKDAAEIIQGQWIVEIGELTAMSRAETNAIKQFLSKKDDVYRAAYGRHSERYPRRCVFFGTSNDTAFLKDITGNRRFWPVSVGVCQPSKSIFDDLDDEVDQIWAEAKIAFMMGEPLFLDGEAERLAKEAQEEYREVNDKEGLIQEFLDKPVPENWDSLSLGQRRQFLQGNLTVDETSLAPRNKVCALEVWCECLGGDARHMRRQDGIEINNILSILPGWTKNSTSRRYGYCGKQRGFERIV